MLEFKSNRIKNVCLIGFMGSGKSIIGKELSNKYNIDFIDTDKEIEKKVGKSINVIFSDYGENYFRNIEEEVCLDVIEHENCIISLGGGSVTNLKIRNIIKKNSYSIYLKVKKDIILKRLKNSQNRPLLKNGNKEKIIEELYNNRKKFYNEANLIIHNNYDKKEIISKIYSEINNL